MRELKYPCTCSSSIERLNCKENCDHVKQKQWAKEDLTEAAFRIGGNAGTGDLTNKPITIQPSNWIVFREFDTEKEAKEYAEFFGLTKFIWKIEKR